MKFEDLVSRINENQNYQLNQAGMQQLQQYHSLIQQIENAVVPVIKQFVVDPEKLKKEIAVQVVSTINSQQLGTPEFEIMSRLDTLTNGGQTPIDGGTFTFNQQDPILKYLESLG